MRIGEQVLKETARYVDKQCKAELASSQDINQGVETVANRVRTMQIDAQQRLTKQSFEHKSDSLTM